MNKKEKTSLTEEDRVLSYLDTVPNSVTDKFINKNSPKILYHYTDISALLQIISIDKINLWASNVIYLNDKSEIYTGLETVCKTIYNFIKDKSNITTTESILEDVRDCIENAIKKRDLSIFSDKDIYAVSFCENGDLLNMWRGYAPHKGVSIGISPKLICQQFEGTSFNLPKAVIYDENQQVQMTETLLAEIVNKLNQCLNNINIYKYKLNIRNKILNLIMEIIPLFKNKSFKDEKEWRYVFSYYKENSFYKLNFRTKNSIIIPYLEISIKNKKPGAIKTIYVGPNNEEILLKDGIKYFIKQLDINAKVELSKIPFRG